MARKLIITNKRRFIGSMTVLTILLLTILYGIGRGIYAIVDDSVVYKGVRYERISDSGLVGWYQLAYKYGDGTPVFKITTPRGVEKVVGYMNLQVSLDQYRDDGIYGLSISAAYDKIKLMQLDKWYGI